MWALPNDSLEQTTQAKQIFNTYLSAILVLDVLNHVLNQFVFEPVFITFFSFSIKTNIPGTPRIFSFPTICIGI